ncbi:hypothetical protein PHISP_01741 [Aspergillus sp. HF37]|nr:hypothetical protein PHISP_01741 [Aspergillus sp. HF37]
MSKYSRAMPAFSEYDAPHSEPALGLAYKPRKSPCRGYGAQVYERTYMYFCCSCNDGPKTYNMQPVCVNCQHKACKYCNYVKH